MSDRTRDKILDTAERLFAEQGVAATSLRAIMAAAGANMAAIHYHFGSRDGLIHALVARCVLPINQSRLDMLDAVERAHPTGPIPADAIVRAFSTPVVELVADPERGHVSKLMGRVVMETTNPEAMARVFGPTAPRFIAAIRRAVPGLSEDEARARLHFLVGTLVFTMAVPRIPTRAHSTREDLKTRHDQLVAYASAGLMATATSTPRRNSP
jgi:AcrR family transcriptional regulator